VVKVNGAGSGRLSMVGLIATRPGSRTRLCYRVKAHRGHKGERRSLSEADYIALLDTVHQQLRAPIILVWDRLNTHRSAVMRRMIAARPWLRVFSLPAYAPDLNPVEAVWSHVKRSLANLTAGSLKRLEALVRNRLKSLQYRPCILDGFIAGTGLTLQPP
jgi:transposase